MDLCGDSNALATAGSAETAPASFMGLPPELRLRIYDFLFRDTVEEMKHTARDVASEPDVQRRDNEGGSRAENQDQQMLPNGARRHCCTFFGERRGVRPPTCTCCTDRLNPAILSTNSLIYNEALPVFYSWVEPRIYFFLGWYPDGQASIVRMILEEFPKKCVQFISRIVLVSIVDVLSLPEHYHHYDPSSIQFKQLFNAIESSLPNIKHVRIHIDLEETFAMADYPCAELSRVMQLPKLKTMKVELACTELREPSEFINKEGERRVDFQETVAASMRKEAERMGKRVEVIVC